MRRKYIITNLVYGDLYLKIFLDHHVKSVMDLSNLPEINSRYEIRYVIFTDNETAPKLESSPIIADMLKYFQVEIIRFGFGEIKGEARFDARYSVLMNVFKKSLEMAIEQNALLTAWVADLVVAKHFFKSILGPIEQGHGAVFMLPMRTAYEPMKKHLDQINGAPDASTLFRLGFSRLHPLWVACHWRAPRFTNLPFAMLWTSRTGLMARSFSVTPIVFEPNQDMLQSRGMIDGDIPSLCRNPYWAQDWLEAPVMGVEPLFCYYDTIMSNRGSNATGVRLWAKAVLHPTQIPFAKKYFYYPSKKMVRMPFFEKWNSDRAIKRITK